MGAVNSVTCQRRRALTVDCPVMFQVSALALTFGERLLVVGTGDADKPGRVRARVLSNADNEYSER